MVPNRKVKTRCQKLKQYFKEYCSTTSIHGFQYFGQNRTYAEKFWWLFTFAIILSLCSLCIFKIYEKYEQSPVIISIATKDTPIYDIPFPAVTICPSVKVSNEKCLRYSEVALRKIRNETVSPEEDNIFNSIAPLCNEGQDLGLSAKLDSANTNANQTYTEEFFDILDRCNPVPPENFLRATWMGKTLKINQLKKIITQEGVCYTFNMLDRSDIFQDTVAQYKDFHVVTNKVDWDPAIHQYLKIASRSPGAYPRRALFSGATNALEFTIKNFAKDVDYRCKQTHQGYKIVLHQPSRVPTPRQEFVIAPFNQASMVEIEPRFIETSERVKQYPVSKRNCVFAGETPLRYFKLYTKQNCDLELLTNVTLRLCNCSAFYMPRENDTTICGIGAKKCVNEVLHFNNFYNIIRSQHGPDKIDPLGKKQSWSQCLPLCTDITYDMILSHVPWDWHQYILDLGGEPNLNESIYLTSITLYFKSSSITTLERNELYGPLDFLSNFGGLLGLFTGFSILSLVEIIYFGSIRMLGNVRLFGQWYGT